MMEAIDENEDGCELVHENSSTRILVYRLSDPNNEIGGGRTGSVAVKVLAQERPDPARLRILHDEYELSRIPALSRCSAVRAALRRTRKSDGSHAIWLEWAEGVTLREWRRANATRPSSPTARYDDLCRQVRLARAIAGAIAEMHDAGVVHNRICDTNIIVDDHSGDKAKCNGEADEGRDDEERVEFSVKMIDLGSAVLLNGNDPIVSMCAKQNDLCSLGAILYAMFSGEFPSIHQHSDQILHSKVSIASDAVIESFPPPPQELERKLRFNGALPCLAMLVSKLIFTRKESKFGWGYESATELQQDLDHICYYPDRFLLDNVGSGIATGGTLEFPPDRLYGRTVEVSAVSDAFDRVIRNSGRSEMILLSGASGTGKTALVHHMQEPLVKRGAIFLKGKFDLVRQVEALSAITCAFAGYCESVLVEGGDDLYRLRTALHNEVGADGISVLIDFVPSLQRVMGPDHPAAAKTVVGGKEAQHRLTQMFRLLARAISSKSRPLVLFLDDLQWADVASLELMRSMTVDHENKMLLIGSYRDNEVDSSDPLSLHLDEVEALGVPVTRIELQNITNDAINRFISETFRVPLSVSNRLAGIVHGKTNGNFFFAKQYLASLCDADLLRYSAQSRSWLWDLQQINSIDVVDSAIGLTLQSIAKLPARTQRAISVAACLGSHCDEDILRLIQDRDIIGVCMENSNVYEYSTHDPDQGLAEALDIAVDRRLMGKDRTRYYFLHDQIYQAALSLITDTARPKLHRLIGMCIWKQSQQAKLDWYLFVAVDNLYLGSSLVKENDKIDLAQLYLRAGQKAKSLSLLRPASTYLKAGIDLLGPGHWTGHYDLSLHLFKLYADTEYCNGREMGYFLEQILRNAKCFDHKLGAYYTLISALGARGREVDAAKNSFHVLQELGESFPARGSLDLESYTLDEWEETRSMLDEFSDETLITMKDMTDKRKMWAMKFLNLLTVYTYLAEQEYFPVASMRMVQLTVSYGFCTESAVGFAWYGLIQCSQFGDFKRGYQFGQLALRLLERSDSKESLCRVYAIVYARINHWTQPLRLSLEPLLRSHQFGKRSGDVEFSMINVGDWCLHGLQSGVRLSSLEDTQRAICHEMREYKMDGVLGPTLVVWQFVLNLMGRSVDPLRLTGDAMDEEKMEKYWVEIDMSSFSLCHLYFFRMWIAYLYGEHVLAAEMAERSRNMAAVNPGAVAVSNHAFLDGMVSLALARKTKKKKWRIAARKALKKVESWSLHAPCNFGHKVKLLEAEFAFLEEDWGNAERAYEAGIALAGENGFVQDQALACERAALLHLARGDQPRASEYYDKAYDYYMEWGALGKADHVKRCLRLMFHDDNS